MSNARPIFVTGPDRSGTSLMFAVLGSHPNISMVRRTNLWRWFYGQYGDLSQPDNFEACLQTMLRYTRMDGLHLDPDRIRREFWQGDPSYGRLFDLVHSHHAELFGKSRWGDKSLHTEHHAAQVFAEFPNATIIHMIRDPRDRYSSIIKRYAGRKKGVASTTAQWLSSVARATRNAQRYPGRYLAVRYESLAQQPEETLHQVCEFIGEEFSPCMLRMDGIPEHRDGGNSSFGRLEPGKISARSVGRYRTVLTPQEVAFIQGHAGSQMAEYHYDLDAVHFATKERMSFYLAEFPLTSVKLIGARLRYDLLEPKGQKVPPHRLKDLDAGQDDDGDNPPTMPYINGNGASGTSPGAGKDKLNLLYVIGTYPSLTTTFIDREIEYLRSKGIRIQVLAVWRPPGELSAEQKRLGEGVIYLLPAPPLRVVWAHLATFLRHPWTYGKTLFHLATRPHPTWQARLKTVFHFGEGIYAAHLVRGQTYSHIHAHFIDRATTIAMIIGRLRHLPYSITAHAADIYVNPTLLSEKMAGAKFVATCTGYNRAYLAQLGGQTIDPKLHCIYHGIDITDYEPRRRHTDSRPLLLAVGQLKEKKGFTYLIEACRMLKERGYNFTCEIVGDGPLRARLEAQIRDQGLEGWVSLCGALPHDAVIEKYARAAIFVLACTTSTDGDRDGIPNVILEAMAMGLPVVSTRHSGIPEVVRDGENGYLVEPADSAGIANALAALLDNPQSWATLGQKGRQSVQELFSIDQNAERLLAQFLT